MLEVIAELEDRFDISIPLNDVPATRNVAQVVAQVAQLVESGRAPRLMHAAAHVARGARAGRAAGERGYRFVVDGVAEMFVRCTPNAAAVAAVARALREAGLAAAATSSR